MPYSMPCPMPHRHTEAGTGTAVRTDTPLSRRRHRMNHDRIAAPPSSVPPYSTNSDYKLYSAR